MAESALTPDPLERYAAIERAYCEERWMAVIHDGQTLLSDLAHSMEAPPEGLKERLQLLVGHAFLYGLGDRDSAEDHYQEVLRSGAEPSLRQIAEQGLQQCVLPLAPVEIEQQEESGDSPSGLVSRASDAAAAWQEDGAWDSPAEPTPASPADSAPTPGPDIAAQSVVADTWGTAASQPGSEPTAALSWLTAGSTAVPSQAAGQPVMPWLESSAPAAASSTGPSQPEPAVEPEDLAASRMQPEPQAAPLSPQPAEPLAFFAAAPSEVAPAADMESRWEPATSPGDAEPPFSPETAASLTATAAAVAAALESSEIDAPPEPLPVVSAGSSRGSVEAPELPDLAMASSDLAADSAISPPSLAAVERLEADVVEEPELIELHQASEQPRELILLETAATDAAPDQPSAAELVVPMAIAASMPLPSSAEPALADRRQDRRGSDAEGSNLQDDFNQPAAEPAPVAAISRVQPAVGLGPFSAPPQPVAEEDPELLMSLLKVEMG